LSLIPGDVRRGHVELPGDAQRSGSQAWYNMTNNPLLFVPHALMAKPMATTVSAQMTVPTADMLLRRCPAQARGRRRRRTPAADWRGACAGRSFNGPGPLAPATSPVWNRDSGADTGARRHGRSRRGRACILQQPQERAGPHSASTADQPGSEHALFEAPDGIRGGQSGNMGRSTAHGPPLIRLHLGRPV
jgi:hypothetical protein